MLKNKTWIGWLMMAAATVASGDLIAYYTFDGDANDASGNGNTGTVGASVAFDADVPTQLSGGQSIRGTAVNGYAGVVAVPNSASLETLKDTMTVSFWIKADWTASANWVRIMRRGEEGDNADNAWIINRNNNNNDLLIRLDTEGGGGTFNQNRGGGFGTLVDNQWHHIAYVLDNGSVAEYVDGAETYTGTYPHGTGFDNSAELLILGRTAGNVDGWMDEVAIFNNPLDAGKVLQLSQGVAADMLIPEPSTFTLLLLGAAGLCVLRRKQV
jgi:hypothetical protein